MARLHGRPRRLCVNAEPGGTYVLGLKYCEDVSLDARTVSHFEESTAMQYLWGNSQAVRNLSSGRTKDA